MDLRLRPLRLDDEAAVLAAHEALAHDDFTFALGYEPGMAWADFVAFHERARCGIDLAPDRVPATFLLAVVGDALVGRASIRHQLNDFLLDFGGHIGYCVVPEHRRRGHAAEILRQSLVVARAAGVEAALLTCDDDNEASAKVIERWGGVLENVVDHPDSGTPLRRYWIA